MDKFVVRKRKRTQPTEKASASTPPENETETTIKKVKVDGSDVSDQIPAAPGPVWDRRAGNNLNLGYCRLYSKGEADEILGRLEKEVVWNTGRVAQVQLFGKWHNIPRKQAAYGDPGLSYTFSNNTVPAKPWTPLLQEIRDKLAEVSGQSFNFVLVNRYKDGSDHMGEHRDDEKDLVQKSPIASVSFGQKRDFVFKHRDARGRHAKRRLSPVTLELEHGSLLMMNYPTNTYWYHSLPARKNVPGTRINLTFRDFVVDKKQTD